MPPYEGNSVYASPTNDQFIAITDNRVVRTKDGEPFTSIPVPSRQSQHDGIAVFSQRDVIVGVNPLHDVYNPVDDIREPTFTPKRSKRQANPGNFYLEMMDQYFGCMCLGADGSCGPPHGEKRSLEKPTNLDMPSKLGGDSKKYIVYPIARYPERLNSPVLVAQRRKSLMKHLTFQPVRPGS